MVWCPLVWDSERILWKGLSIFRFQPLPFLKPTHKGNDRIPTIHLQGRASQSQNFWGKNYTWKTAVAVLTFPSTWNPENAGISSCLLKKWYFQCSPMFSRYRRFPETHFDQPLGFLNTRFQLTKGVTSQKTGDPNGSQTPFGWKMGIQKKRLWIESPLFQVLGIKQKSVNFTVDSSRMGKLGTPSWDDF